MLKMLLSNVFKQILDGFTGCTAKQFKHREQSYSVRN